MAFSGDSIYKVGAGVLFMLIMIIPAALFIVGGAFGGTGESQQDGNDPLSGGGTLSGCDTSKGIFQGLPPPSLGSSKVPGEFVPFYEDSAASAGLGDCGAAILAATHSIECSYGGDGACNEAHDGGVLGPMQFMQSTWDGEIANPETKKNCDASSSDILKVQKAICVAAFHDKHNGAPGDWRGAIYLYNHADWYVDGVLARAKDIASRGGSGKGSAERANGGNGNGNGGSQ